MVLYSTCIATEWLICVSYDTRVVMVDTPTILGLRLVLHSDVVVYVHVPSYQYSY